jgi:tRNA (uracil-5-)-methyltransferase
MRAEFRVWHDGDRSYLAMFDSDDPKTPIEVPAFPMGSERINDLMPRFLEEIGKSEVIRRKLFQVNFLTTRKGDALVSMLYHKPVKTDGWAEAAEEMRQRLGVSIIGRSRKQKVSHRPHTHTHTPPARFHAAFTSTTHAAAGIPKTRKMNHTIESIPELRLW